MSTFKIALFIKLCLLNSIALSQVTEYNDLVFPENIVSAYPFLENKVIEIQSPQKDKDIGYFIFLINKEKFKDFYEKKQKEELSNTLDKYGFYRGGVCYLDLNLCALTGKSYHTLIQNYHLDLLSSNNMLIGYQNIRLHYNFKLRARLKVVDYVSSVFPPRICEEETSFTNDFDLVSANVSNNFYPTLFQNGINLLNDGYFTGQVLYSECNMCFGNPYCNYTTYSQPIPLNISTINVSEIDELFEILFTDSKKIKITEDKTFFYVYTIKKK